MPEPDYAAERRLPAGMTCAACRHGSRCDGLFGAVRKAFTSCDFWPSRFIAAAEGTAEDEAEACTCQCHPTHQANDCPKHGLDEPTYTAGERVDAGQERCAAPGCDTVTDQGICDACDRWVDAEVVKLALDPHDRQIETLRRALVWHGDLQRMATTREEWQQEIDDAIAWVKANPEPDRPSFSTLSALAAPACAPGEVERLHGELRRIAEGNLGDAPWQANYARIKEIALAALSPQGLDARDEQQLYSRWIAGDETVALTRAQYFKFQARSDSAIQGRAL